MRLIDRRTPEQWAAYDRAKLVVSVALALLLLVLWLTGRGPGRAAPCCAVPETAAVAPPVAPAMRPAPTPDPCGGALDSRFLFASNSAEVSPEGRGLLERLAPCWRKGRFEVQGHTDGSGTDAINQTLSERRAQAVRDVLLGHGIAAAALSARGYGSTRPVASNETAEGRAKNRRVELRRQ